MSFLACYHSETSCRPAWPVSVAQWSGTEAIVCFHFCQFFPPHSPLTQRYDNAGSCTLPHLQSSCKRRVHGMPQCDATSLHCTLCHVFPFNIKCSWNLFQLYCILISFAMNNNNNNNCPRLSTVQTCSGASIFYVSSGQQQQSLVYWPGSALSQPLADNALMCRAEFLAS